MPHHKLPVRWSLALLLVSVAGCASIPGHPDHFNRGDEDAAKAYLTKFIDYQMRKSSITGLSIAVVDDQRVVWAQGFGFADLEKKIPATAQTIYRVGSISKLFTDTAVMQLVEQGKIDIDRPLQNYLPEFSILERGADAQRITPRQLMTHHAGLPRDVLKGFQNPQPQPIAQVVADLHDVYAPYAPGEIFYYSNVGVTLLGNAIERVSGTPFPDHMKQHLLLPLGMSDSSFDTGRSASPLMAKGYHRNEARTEPPMRDVPAGGLNTSVSEMSRFMSMIFAGGVSGGHRILEPGTVEAMLQPQNGDVALDLNFQVGLGWMLSTLGRSTLQGAGVVAHHAGSIETFRSQIYLLPQHKLGVVVLANSDSAAQAIDQIANQALAAELEVLTGIQQPPYVPVPPAPGPVPAAVMDALAGRYTTIAGPVKVYVDGGALHADLAGHPFGLVWRTDGLFALDYSVLGFIHVNLGSLADVGLALRNVAGRSVLVARIGAQEMLVGEKLASPVDPGRWRNRLGDYTITNLDGDRKFVDRIRLSEDHGYLLVELTATDSPDQNGSMVLLPTSDTEALLLGALNDAGETVRVITIDGEERLVGSGYQAKRSN